MRLSISNTSSPSAVEPPFLRLGEPGGVELTLVLALLERTGEPELADDVERARSRCTSAISSRCEKSAMRIDFLFRPQRSSEITAVHQTKSHSQKIIAKHVSKAQDIEY